MAMKILFLTVFYLSINFPFIISYNPVIKILSTQLSDKSTVLPLAQLLMTAKLVKDLQQKTSGKSKGIDKTNYLVFLGKGNIQFQNHELEVANSTEEVSSETTTTSYEDLVKNKHLLKFIARNGYQVWKRMLVSPSIAINETDPMHTSSSNQINQINQTNQTNQTMIFDQKKSKKSDRKKSKSLPLYKPDVQKIETEEGIIEHKVNTPQWFQNVIENGLNNKKDSNQLNQFLKKEKNTKDLFGMPNNEYKKTKGKNKVALTKRKNTSKKSNEFPEASHSIGRIAIKGLNGLIRGISSLLGIGQKENTNRGHILAFW